MKKCPNCGQDNNDFNQVCEVCHTPLPNTPNYTENNYGAATNNPNNNYNNMNNNYNQNQTPNNYNPNNGYNQNNGYNPNNGYNQNNGYNPNGNYNANNFNQGQYPPQQNNSGTYALVFGILSIVCCAIIFGPLAIIKGNEAKDSNGNIGKILGIVGLVLWAVAIVFNIVLGGIFSAANY